MLESDNTFRLYMGFIGVDPEDLLFSIDDIPIEVIMRSDGMFYLAMDTGVWSNRLQDAHEYTISDGENTYTVTASALTYTRSGAAKTNEKESNLGKALYLYNQAAIAAFGK